MLGILILANIFSRVLLLKWIKCAYNDFLNGGVLISDCILLSVDTMQVSHMWVICLHHMEIKTVVSGDKNNSAAAQANTQ